MHKEKGKRRKEKGREETVLNRLGYEVSKRAFDFIFSLMGLIVLSPVLLIITFLVKIDSPGPAFYKGLRVGRNGCFFRMFKFRTMYKNAELTGGTSTAEDDPRITSMGRFLRRSKADELPQLINVLRGEMSIVGPRPQVPWAVERYSGEEKTLLSVLPGITDYASLRFSNEAEILKGSRCPDKDYLQKIAPDKIRLGLDYVKTRSFWVDVKIILMTFKKVLLN